MVGSWSYNTRSVGSSSSAAYFANVRTCRAQRRHARISRYIAASCGSSMACVVTSMRTLLLRLLLLQLLLLLLSSGDCSSLQSFCSGLKTNTAKSTKKASHVSPFKYLFFLERKQIVIPIICLLMQQENGVTLPRVHVPNFDVRHVVFQQTYEMVPSDHHQTGSWTRRPIYFCMKQSNSGMFLPMQDTLH